LVCQTLEQRRRALDVREQESDCPLRELDHPLRVRL
jgi:hypothetical protein